MVPAEQVLQTGTRGGSKVRSGHGIRGMGLGFVAGFLSVSIFSNGAIAALYEAGLFPMPAWSFTPVPPLGVPHTLSAAFWGGLWGIAYALLELRLTRHLGWWPGGLVFGAVLPCAVFLFVVPLLKGMPIGPGLVPAMFLLIVALHAIFGLGTAIFFRLGRTLIGRKGGRLQHQ